MMSNNSSNVNRGERGNNDGRNDNQQSEDTEGSKHDVIQSPLKFTCTLCEKVIFAVDVDHTIL